MGPGCVPSSPSVCLSSASDNLELRIAPNVMALLILWLNESDKFMELLMAGSCFLASLLIFATVTIIIYN